MTPVEAERVRESACTGKVAYGASTAREIARTSFPGSAHMAGYRCPFCGHWHVGHALSVDGMRFLAEAIRVLGGDGPGSAPGTIPKAERRRLRRSRLNRVADPTPGG